MQWRNVTISMHLMSLPSHLQSPSPLSLLLAIILVLTPHPFPLSAHLLVLGMDTQPITWPTIPKGKDCVWVYLHATNTKDNIDGLVNRIVKWAEDTLKAQKKATQTELPSGHFSWDSVGGNIH